MDGEYPVELEGNLRMEQHDSENIELERAHTYLATPELAPEELEYLLEGPPVADPLLTEAIPYNILDEDES